MNAFAVKNITKFCILYRNQHINVSAIVTWTGQGIGRFTSPGKTRFTGSLLYSTSSTGKLAFLNNLVGVFEYETDESGTTSAKVWEWM
jgi:hypothetical protein